MAKIPLPPQGGSVRDTGWEYGSSGSAADVSKSSVTATGASSPRTLADHLANLPDFMGPLPESQGGTGAATLGQGIVTATGGTTARGLADRFADAVNVKDFGAKGDGITDDTAAFTAALAAAGAAKPVYVPAGTFLVNGVKLSTGQRIIGLGWWGSGNGYAGDPGASVLRARDAATTAVIELDGQSSTAYYKMVEIANLVIEGSGGPLTTAGVAHGIYIHDGNYGGHSDVYVHDVSIQGVGGKGVYAPTGGLWHSRLMNVQVDYAGDNAIEINSGITTTIENCYVHRLATGKVAYRILGGQIAMRDCNGIDGPSTGATWGVFGSKIADGDAADLTVNGVIETSNVEYFGPIGIWFKSGSFCTLLHNIFSNSRVSNTAKAIQADGAGEGWLLVGNRYGLDGAGAAWTNGYAIHSSNYSPLVIGKEPGTYGAYAGTAYYDDVAAAHFAAASIRSWSGYLGLSDFVAIGGGQEGNINPAQADTIATFGYSKSWDPPLIADGAATTTTLTISGVAVGDAVTSVRFSQAVPAGAMLTATVSAANTVAITLFNKTGADLDLPSGTVRVMVSR